LLLDVADADAVFAAADAVAAEAGGIDIWINDPMVTVFSPVWHITLDEFRRVTEVIYLGFVHGHYGGAATHEGGRSRHHRPVGSALAYRVHGLICDLSD